MGCQRNNTTVQYKGDGRIVLLPPVLVYLSTFQYSPNRYLDTVIHESDELTGGIKMRKIQSHLHYISQRIGVIGLVVPISILLLLGFFLLGRGQMATLRAAGEAQVQSLAMAVNDVFIPVIFNDGDPGSGGHVFRDYNANGARDTAEPGVPGIIVSAYNADGYRAAYDITDAWGEYNLYLPAGEDYRLEFTGIPDYLQPGAVGNDTEATVAFVTAPAAGVNVGLNNPADYCQDNPELGTPCYLFGNQKQALPALVSFNYRAGSTSLTDPFLPLPADGGSPYDDANNDVAGIQKHPIEADVNEIGTTNGLAYQRAENVIFAGAFMKRHSGFGPNGTGAIYRIDRDGDTVSVYADLNAIFGANTAGADPHDGTALTDPAEIIEYYIHDPSFDQVGKISLGDIEITEDEAYLYTVNLNDKMLYRIPVLNEASPAFTTADIARFALPSPAGCAVGDVRPFGLGVQDGVLYAGMVCSAQSTQQASDMRAYVYAFDGSSFDGTPVLDFALNYPRACADRIPGNEDCGTQVDNKEADWNPWVGTFGDLLMKSGAASVNTTRRIPIYPQPLLTDIEFASGYMIIGLRDRNGDMIGNGTRDPRDANGNPIGFPPEMSSPTQFYMTATAGDILTAAHDPVRPGVWKLEDNASVGDLPPTAGANNNNGPGGGEYFFDDSFAVVDNDFPRHAEVAQGGLSNIPGQTDALTTSFNPIPQEDPSNFFDGGIIYLSGQDGSRSRSYRVFAGEPPPTTPPIDETALLQGKNNGLGDLEVFCEEAPLEIGDKVWFDSNKNGIQDPDEDPMAGMNVMLYTADNTLLATAVTDIEGNYYFSNAASGPLAGEHAKYGVEGLQPNTEGYVLRIDLTQPAISASGYMLTVANADGHVDNNNKTDLRDSDAVMNGQNAEIAFESGAAGHNNHTLDFGFIDEPVTPPVAVGNRVWLDDGQGGGTAGDGIVNGTELGIGSVEVQLYPGSGVTDTPLQTTTTGADGCYLFDNLAAGDYILHIPGSQFEAGNPLQDLFSSDPEGGDTADDDNVDENGQNIPVNNGISSTIINLTVGDEPTNEPSRTLCASTQPDANENMTVDFGFTPDIPIPVAVGNRVWLDDGKEGGTAGDGIVNGNEMGIDGVEVQLHPGTGVTDTPLQTTSTADNGCYLFDNLVSGNYIIYIPADEFTEIGLLNGLVSSLPEGGDTPDDDDLDENGQNTPVNGGIGSTIINLTAGSEPTNEPSRSLCASTQPDANENMTVDFGFSPPDLPGISIVKYTNGQDANEPILPGVPQIPPGELVTWTYDVTNTGNVSFAKEDVEVTDSQGVVPLFDSVQVGDDDDFLDPGEVWQYKATGVAGVVGPPQLPGGVPVLWGVNEDKDGLFTVDDYTLIPEGAIAAGLTNYGRLNYTDLDGVTQLIGRHIGSFTIDTDNVAYMAYNKNLDMGGGQPPLKAPVMMSFNLADASTTEPNIVNIIGSIPIPGFDISSNVDDNISGLSFDPTTGELYALYRVTDGPTPDRLLLVSKDDASLLKDFGVMSNETLGVIVEDGEALEFDQSGNLYVSDNWDDHLYQIDPETGLILSIIDNDQLGGLGVNSLKTEGLAWDPLQETMVASEDDNDLFFIQTFENGNNISLGSLPGLTDVESIDFRVSCYMNMGQVSATVTVGGVISKASDIDPSHYCN